MHQMKSNPFFTFDRILRWPFNVVRGVMSIKEEDIGALEESEFLNDTIIEFYLRYLMTEKAPKFFEDVHLFSSFFYSTLRNTGTE